MSADPLFMSDSWRQTHLRSVRSILGLALVLALTLVLVLDLVLALALVLVPALVLVHLLVLVLTGESGGHPGVSSRPRCPPCCRAASRLRGCVRAAGGVRWPGSGYFWFQRGQRCELTVSSGFNTHSGLSCTSCCTHCTSAHLSRWLKEVRGTINVTPGSWHHGNKTAAAGSPHSAGGSEKVTCSHPGQPRSHLSFHLKETTVPRIPLHLPAAAVQRGFIISALTASHLRAITPLHVTFRTLYEKQTPAVSKS